jgi:hypothetical protein
MTPADARFGFRVVGGPASERRLVDPAAAFAAHAAADPKAEPARECYLSAFRFGTDFRGHLAAHRTPKGFVGACWSPWLWFDVDRTDLAVAQTDTKRLVGFLLFRYSEFGDDDPLYFFSGAKGFHVALPLTHCPPPSEWFHRVCRTLAARTAADVGVAIDAGIYDRVRLLRAPNSAHPATGMHKRQLTHDELMGLSADRVRELARTPHGFDVPAPTAVPALLPDDWRDAEDAVKERPVTPPRAGEADGRLARATLEFIREGAVEGERHTRLFRAAANLREFAAPVGLVHALLTETALDTGLPPAEVRRQIDCGIAHADGQAAAKGGAA